MVSVLDFEPNNTTAKEFYPLIEEKLKCELEFDKCCLKTRFKIKLFIFQY